VQFLREMIISLLRLSRTKPILQKHVNREAKVPSDVGRRLLQTLQRDGLIYVRNGSIEINSLQRVRLATRAFELGADHERVSSVLEWKEFESVSSIALETQGYAVKTNLHFRQGGRRWELDVVGCRKPLVVCVDCKHWHRGLYPSKFKKAADEQAKRTLAFAESLPNPTVKVECSPWKEANFVPVILSLMSTGLNFHCGTPIVPILQLQDFLAQLPLRLDTVTYFRKTQTSLMDSL
jgi:hypothetical protein